MGSITEPLEVIVVGAGFGGLGAAIECRQKGMKVMLVEKYTDSNTFGDIIDFFPNGGRIIQSWDDGKVGDELRTIGITKAECMELHKYDGKLVYKDPWFHSPGDEMLQFAGHRGGLHSIIMAYVRRLGVELKLGSPVVDYKETESKAGVILETGEQYWADCIIAADGSRSLAREKVLGLQDEKVSSGWAVYRTFFNTTDEMRAHPLLKDFTQGERDTIKVWVGGKATMLCYSWNQGRDIAWVLMHPDRDDIIESWSLKVDKQESAKWMTDFSDECKAILEVTPDGKMIDYKLVYREPLKRWRSQGGRTILIGDACHAHLPSSAQGGSQALEDAVTVAVCLEKAGGAAHVIEALQVAERIRYNRSNVLHARGAKNRDEWAEIPWDLFEKDPKMMANRREPWMLEFDARKTAEQWFDKMVRDVREGRQGTLEELSVPAQGS